MNNQQHSDSYFDADLYRPFSEPVGGTATSTPRSAQVQSGLSFVAIPRGAATDNAQRPVSTNQIGIAAIPAAPNTVESRPFEDISAQFMEYSDHLMSPSQKVGESTTVANSGFISSTSHVPAAAPNSETIQIAEKQVRVESKSNHSGPRSKIFPSAKPELTSPAAPPQTVQAPAINEKYSIVAEQIPALPSRPQIVIAPAVAPPTPELKTQVASIQNNLTQTSPQFVAEVPQSIQIEAKKEEATPFEATNVKIEAAWEVDSFQWPEIASRLLREQSFVYQQLLETILKLGTGRNVVGITGADEKDGKTTLGVCLARWAANRGLRTILVEGPQDQVALANLAGLDFSLGWFDWTGEATLLGESIVRSISSNLSLTPFGATEGQVNTFAFAPKLNAMLDQLRRQYDLVLVDVGSIANFSKASRQQTIEIDMAILVRNQRTVSIEKLDDVYRQLVGLGIESIAIAENFGRKRAGA